MGENKTTSIFYDELLKFQPNQFLKIFKQGFNPVKYWIKWP